MREHRDIIGGSLLILLGGYAATHAALTLRLGTIWQMGPGMFPAAIGVIIAMFGVAIFASGLMRKGEPIAFDLRSLALITMAVAAFALLIRPLGIVPAIVALVLISTRADNRLSLRGAVLLAAALSLMAVLIFSVGLGMPWPLFSWRW